MFEPKWYVGTPDSYRGLRGHFWAIYGRHTFARTEHLVERFGANSGKATRQIRGLHACSACVCEQRFGIGHDAPFVFLSRPVQLTSSRICYYRHIWKFTKADATARKCATK